MVSELFLESGGGVFQLNEVAAVIVVDRLVLLTFAHQYHSRVAGDAIEPSAKFRFTSESRQIFPCGSQGILKRILRIVLIFSDAHAHAPGDVLVPGDKFREGTLVAFACFA